MSYISRVPNVLVALLVTTASLCSLVNQENAVASIHQAGENSNVRSGSLRIAQGEQGYAEAQRRIQTALETQATSLDLSQLSLTQVPPEIVQLTNLEWLNLDSNQLSSLPAEVVQLTNLQLLSLKSNQLSSLPAEIVQLTNLQGLDLDSNQLSSLPA
ncbi:MAG: leucine-rich repeat domain-containing protein, partial [Thermosynechococcaceae cyanobacterium]